MSNERFRLKIVKKIEEITTDINELEKTTLKFEGKEKLAEIHYNLEKAIRDLKYKRSLYDL